MIGLLKLILSVGFLVGLPVGILATTVYFIYTGSILNWKRKK